ncbi:MAG: hypothetical protein IJ081_04600 [Prevotella sp.]|nr:hypothetical protein [Prevotella sp.]
MFDFFNSLSTTQQILLGFVPLFLVIINAVLNVLFRRKESVAFANNGSIFMMFFFLVYVGSVAAQYCVKYLPHSWFGDSIFDSVTKEGVPDNSILWYIFYLTVAYFICYYLVSFRPINEEQLKDAIAHKNVVLGGAKVGDSAINAVKTASMSIGISIWSACVAVFYALFTSIWLILGGLIGCIILGVILLPIFGGLFYFGTLFLMFVGCIIVWVITALKFLKNLYVILVGPSHVKYKAEKLWD